MSSGRAARLAVVATLLLVASRSSAADPSYLAELLAAADAADLARSAQWLALLHHEPDLIGSGTTSLAHTGHFFLSSEGRSDPRAELRATLTAFVDPDARAADGGSVACAFPARYRVLDARLGFDRTRMPDPSRCVEFERWMSGMQPEGLTLVFPEAYMNNPASMFGHTLLRVDPAEHAPGRDLLAYAINFAADTGGDGGAAFAFKGITGFYPGQFSVLPYYDKLKQYGDWENRDIWEYRLSFTPAETELLLAHVWELRGVSFAYYFFDDNCSYQLLALLEVVRPDAALRADFPLWVIPVDTVRTASKQEGLVEDVSWRPSPATRLRYSGSRLAREERHLALDLASGRTGAQAEALPAGAHRARVLGVAYDVLRYRYLAGDVEESESRARSLAILRELSGVDAEARNGSGAGSGAGERTAEDPSRPRMRPDQGHPSARVSTSVGVRDDNPYVELRLRPAFHELMDPVGGYVPGSQIVILDTALRWLPEDEKVRLEELVLVDVTSIAARDDFIRPISWKIATGMRTRLVPDSDDDLDDESVWRTDGGAGLAWQPVDGVLAFGFAEAAADVGGGLDDDYALGPGASVGVLTGDRSDRMRVLIDARALRFVVGDTTISARAGAALALAFSAHSQLELAAAWEHGYGDDWLEARLTFKWFFRRHG